MIWRKFLKMGEKLWNYHTVMHLHHSLLISWKHSSSWMIKILCHSVIFREFTTFLWVMVIQDERVFSYVERRACMYGTCFLEGIFSRVLSLHKQLSAHTQQNCDAARYGNWICQSRTGLKYNLVEHRDRRHLDSIKNAGLLRE